MAAVAKAVWTTPSTPSCASPSQPRRSRCAQSVGTDIKLDIWEYRVRWWMPLSTSGVANVPVPAALTGASCRSLLGDTSVCTKWLVSRLFAGVNEAGSPETVT